MILTGPEIIRQVKNGSISIEPFDEKRVNPNSYNLRLSNRLLTHKEGSVLSTRHQSCDMEEIIIPENGYALKMGVGYLGCTVEKVFTDYYVPEIQGRSSIGRLFMLVHCTAGYGDHGFNGQWTLEIVPLCNYVIVYPEDEILQIQFTMMVGQLNPYRGKYQNQLGPVPSKGVKRHEQKG